MESQRDRVKITQEKSADTEDSRGPRGEREARDEESTSRGTRQDVAQSPGPGQQSDETAHAGATPGFSHERSPAGSLADAATQTGVSEQSAETPRAKPRSLDDFGRDGPDRLEMGGHNSGARNPVNRREDAGNTLDALNNATEAAPQKPD